ncbi:hypothetical protein GCM10023080_089360 [Streptomyces pseudoechinosporeus]
MLSEPGGVDKLVVKDVPCPRCSRAGRGIRVKASGVNESEVTTGKGLADSDVTLPRMPGIEGAGVVDEARGQRSDAGRPGGGDDREAWAAPATVPAPSTSWYRSAR